MLNPSPEQEAQWENDRRNSFARYLLDNKTHSEIVAWLDSKPLDYREDMRRRLNEQRAIRREQIVINAEKSRESAASREC